MVAQSQDKFHDEIEKLLTGANESSDLVYIKLYKSQIPVVEQALEIAARMLGPACSRGYCLELICADFLAGARLDDLELICADFLAGAGLHLESDQEILLLGLRPS